MVLVYVEGENTAALLGATEKLYQPIQETGTGIRTRVDVILARDFNRYDQLWGGDDVSQERQGEPDPIIDLMSDHALQSLLHRGTKTWQQGNRELDPARSHATYDQFSSCLPMSTYRPRYGGACAL